MPEAREAARRIIMLVHTAYNMHVRAHAKVRSPSRTSPTKLLSTRISPSKQGEGLLTNGALQNASKLEYVSDWVRAASEEAGGEILAHRGSSGSLGGKENAAGGETSPRIDESSWASYCKGNLGPSVANAVLKVCA